MMVEEEAVGGVERSNLLHVLSIKFEVEEIQILLHSFLVNGLRDDDYVALQQPAQGYLCGSLPYFSPIWVRVGLVNSPFFSS